MRPGGPCGCRGVFFWPMQPPTTGRPNRPEMQDRLIPPQRPTDENIRVHGEEDFEEEFITHDGYSPWAHLHTLWDSLVGDRDVRITSEDLERMSRDPKIHKTARIIVHGTLTDDLQFAAGATEEEAGGQFKTFVDIQQFCERVISGLETPYWTVAEQMLVGALEQGHKIAEVVWEYRLDKPARSNVSGTTKKQRGAQPSASLGGWFKSWLSGGDKSTQAAADDEAPATEQNNRFARRGTVRLMPRAIKVKPRNTVLFVVDDYMNVLGLVPVFAGQQSFNAAEVISREKFMVLTLNPRDSDPRGMSAWRPAFGYWSLAGHIPRNYLKLLLQEGMPIPVLTMPKNTGGWYRKRVNGHVVYEADGVTPQRVTAEEAAETTLQRMYLGQGVAIPAESKLEPYRKQGGNVGQAFENAIRVIYNMIEETVLLQPLAQSAGDVQSKSAAMVHADVLGDAFFWYKRAIAVMTLYDLCAVAVRVNLGDWALAYMPMLSLGDSEKRDWARDLEVLAKAFWYGFIDETQRAALMAWLGLPKPGDPGTVAKAQADVNGEPAPPAGQRPDNGDKGRQQPDKATEREEVNTLMRDTFAEVTNRVRDYESRTKSVGHNARRRASFVGFVPGHYGASSTRYSSTR